jgi:hypothetical protein
MAVKRSGVHTPFEVDSNGITQLEYMLAYSLIDSLIGV